jgi:hypothetical protein
VWAETVAAYLTYSSERPSLRVSGGVGGRTRWWYSPATLERWASAISWVHERSSHNGFGKNPVVKDVLSGIRRTRATPPRRKAPILLADLELLLATFDVATWPRATGGLRNRCLLLLGWGGALHRDELVSLNVSDIRLDREYGLYLTIRRSKTDQEADGRTVPIPFGRKPATCAPCAWVRWTRLLAAFEGTDGGPGGRARLMRAIRTTPSAQPVRDSASQPLSNTARSPRTDRAPGTPAADRHVCRGERLPNFDDGEMPSFGPSATTGSSALAGSAGRPSTRSCSGPAPRPGSPMLTSAATAFGPGSSPRHSGTAPTRTPSCARPATSTRQPWRSTPGRTPHFEATPSPRSACRACERSRMTEAASS